MLYPFIVLLLISLFVYLKIAFKYRGVEKFIPFVFGNISFPFLSLLFGRKKRKDPLRFIHFDSIVKIFKKESTSVSKCKKCKNNTFELIASEIGDKNNQIKLYCTRCKSQHYFYIDKNNFVTLLSF